MTKTNIMKRAMLATTVAAMLSTSFAAAIPSAAMAQSSGTYRPSQQVLLSVGEGHLISLPRSVANIWTSNPGVADVNVNNPRQIGLFGKDAGEATVIATAADGSVVYGANVRVSQNISSVDEMLRAALPDARITITHVGQVAVINGTVASPADSAQAEQLVRMFLNPGIDTSSGAALKIVPVNRLKTATPLQVMLKVKIAEVSRSLTRSIGVNLTSQDRSGGSAGGIVGRGRNIGSFDDNGGFKFISPEGISRAGLALTNVLGLDIAGMLDANENSGLVTTLAEPTLTALSGETASFLAGGEFPIPTAQGINGTSVEFKEYGVSLAFTPVVLEGGRISMRVRPEVSEISSAGAVRLNGFEVPALTTRRTETTVELGSGQSFMIGGLLSNNRNNTVEKTPFLGSLPILGALFRSQGFRRNETELVIIVTPYLVKPVNADQIALPTDGYRDSNPASAILVDQRHNGRSGEPRPGPVAAQPQIVPPAVAPVGSASLPAPAAATQQRRAQVATKPSATPGFTF
jgi:pilus assembly protein CpaC